jgi:hypothetical protein
MAIKQLDRPAAFGIEYTYIIDNLKEDFSLVPTGEIFLALDQKKVYLKDEFGRAIPHFNGLGNNVNDVTLKTAADYYEIEEGGFISRLIPNANSGPYFGYFEKSSGNYHLVGMCKIAVDPEWESANRQGEGFYLATFKEDGNDLTLVNIVNVETYLEMDILADLGIDLVDQNISNYFPLVNGLSNEVLNFSYFDFNFSNEGLNTYLYFNVSLDNNGLIVIDDDSVSKRIVDDEDEDTYGNLFGLGESDFIFSFGFFQYGKEFTVNPENPLEFYFIKATTDEFEVTTYSYEKYDFETNTTTIIISDLKVWWDARSTEVDFDEFFPGVWKIVPHPLKTVMFFERSSGSTIFEGQHFLLDFDENIVTEFNGGLSDYTRIHITENKVYVINPWI